MDYEKKYNEALKRARQKIDAGLFTEDDLSYIFPELRESEDERNWKVVLEYIKDDSLRSWLEKQKESLGGTFSSYEMAKTFTDGQNYVMKHPEKFGLQKPAEWSEEDEKKIHFLSRLIEFQVKDGEYCFGEGACAISKQEAIEMLKSLHPSWKPSEEQMKELKDASAVMKCDSDDNAFPSLKTLYEQLQKL